MGLVKKKFNRLSGIISLISFKVTVKVYFPLNCPFWSWWLFLWRLRRLINLENCFFFHLRYYLLNNLFLYLRLWFPSHALKLFNVLCRYWFSLHQWDWFWGNRHSCMFLSLLSLFWGTLSFIFFIFVYNFKQKLVILFCFEFYRLSRRLSYIFNWLKSIQILHRFPFHRCRWDCLLLR